MKRKIIQAKLQSLTISEIARIYISLNKMEWCELLGKEPKNWMKLSENYSNYFEKFFYRILGMKKKIDYIEPILQEIYKFANEKALTTFHS